MPFFGPPIDSGALDAALANRTPAQLAAMGLLPIAQLPSRLAAAGLGAKKIALARSIARVGGILPVLSASPPTIATAATSSAVTGTLISPVSTPGAFQLLRGTWGLAGPGYPLNGVYTCIAVTDPALGNNGGTTSMVRFWSTAPDLEIYFISKGPAFRLKVDGVYVQTGMLGAGLTAGAPYFQRITWGDGSATNRKPRLYELECSNNFPFGGVKVPAIDTIWPATIADALRVIVHGDSFVEGPGSTPAALLPAMAAQIATLIGQPDTAGVGLGGTGYFNVGTNRTTFINRIQPDVIARAPDVVFELGGINDPGLIGGSAATMQGAVTTWLSTLITALPSVLVFMTGPMSPGSGTNTGNNALVRDGKKAAAALFPNNVVFIDNIAEAWVTGTGRSGSTKADGNADWVTGGGDGSDPTHPTDAGNAYIARRIVEAIASRLPLALQ